MVAKENSYKNSPSVSDSFITIPFIRKSIQPREDRVVGHGNKSAVRPANLLNHPSIPTSSAHPEFFPVSYPAPLLESFPLYTVWHSVSHHKILHILNISEYSSSN